MSILFSNAALHWLGNHEVLFPRLLSLSSTGRESSRCRCPTTGTSRPTVSSPSWSTIPAGSREPPRCSSVIRWPNRLSTEPGSEPTAADIDQWRTTYYHVLEGADPVLGLGQGIGLATDPRGSRTRRSRKYSSPDSPRAIGPATPPEADGKTVFPFSRLFMVARRR